MTSTATNARESANDTINPKSPLECSWTFWYLKPDKRTSWEQSLIKLIDVGFVEDFWATFNHLATPAKLASMRTNSDYFFFKQGIRPMWEDKANEAGGRWLYLCGNQDVKLDDLWLETLLGMIGDCFSNDSDPQPLSRYITGCNVSIRNRGHKIALWLSEGQNETVIREIGRRWKSMINLPSDAHIQFDLHNETSSGPPKPARYEA
ncbi:hypothetical protein I4U23_013775 [Adineta vaga]|nr:hypothetical protein I4U23_013775 [Adineta vaga]